jgi:hypothetical protein
VLVLVGWGLARPEMRAVASAKDHPSGVHSPTGPSAHPTLVSPAEISTPIKVRRLPRASSEILAVHAVGALYGTCQPREKDWTLRLLNNTPATDLVVLHVSSSAHMRVLLQPGYELPWRLPANAARTHEPADHPARQSPTTIDTTQPSRIAVSQATEPHTFQAQITLTLAAGGDGSGDCAPIATQISTRTYFNGPR